ncbi:hypothetical protein AOLI_G00118470 [Acnodon oligacanthus]
MTSAATNESHCFKVSRERERETDSDSESESESSAAWGVCQTPRGKTLVGTQAHTAHCNQADKRGRSSALGLDGWDTDTDSDRGASDLKDLSREERLRSAGAPKPRRGGVSFGSEQRWNAQEDLQNMQPNWGGMSPKAIGFHLTATLPTRKHPRHTKLHNTHLYLKNRASSH